MLVDPVIRVKMVAVVKLFQVDHSIVSVVKIIMEKIVKKVKRE